MTMSQLGEGGPPFVVEAEASFGDVGCDGQDAVGCHLGEAVFAKLFAESIEGIIAQDLAVDTILDASAAWPDHQHEPATGNTAQESFDQGGSQKPGRASDGNPLSVERRRYLTRVSSSHPITLPTGRRRVPVGREADGLAYDLWRGRDCGHP